MRSYIDETVAIAEEQRKFSKTLRK